jgi:RNA polymerase sigma-70 factor (ECF subfamily)
MRDAPVENLKEPFTCKGHSTLPVQAANGERFCFNCIVEAFQGHMYNLVARILGDWAAAEDVTQEALVSAYRAFPSFRGDNLRSWILRIAANAARDVLRSQKVRPSVSLDSPDQDYLSWSLSSDEEGPEDYTLRSELRQAIEKCIAGLPEEQRVAITLVDIQGSSYEEAAQVMGVSLGTVKSRISRGRAALRDALQAYGELLPSLFRQDR